MTLVINKDDICYPGQLIAEGNYTIAGGVYKNDKKYYSMFVGVFNMFKDQLSVRPFNSSYYPKIGDVVIGAVEEAMLTSWKIDIGGPYPAILLASEAIEEKFDPIEDDSRKIFDQGDAIRAEIISFDRTRNPHLSTLDKEHGKLVGGRIIETSPNHISRIIGHKGSMIRLIKKHTNTKIIVGHNGRIWIRGQNLDDELNAINAIRKVEQEAHVEGLTNRIETLLKTPSYKEDN